MLILTRRQRFGIRSLRGSTGLSPARRWAAQPLAVAVCVLLASGHALGAPRAHLIEIRPGSGGSGPSGFVEFGGSAFFAADDGVNGTELWTSDGTPDGTVMVKDIRPGSGGSAVSSLVVVGDTLFFAADDGVNGAELWRSDGTADGTVMVKDLEAGPGGSGPGKLANGGGTLYFTAKSEFAYVEMWKSDGTADGTTLLKPLSWAGTLTEFRGNIAFPAEGGTTGTELWASDGTAGGTRIVKDIRSGYDSSGPSDLATMGDTLFFSANDGTHGGELWASDGTSGGTVMVKDIRPGSGESTPRGMTASGGTLYFSAFEAADGWQLWKSDGTTGGTVRVKLIQPGLGATPDYLTDANGTLYFSAYDATHGQELWMSDGTEDGTVLVRDINPGLGGGGFPYESHPSELTPIGGRLYFRADDGAAGVELWTSDGTEAGTLAVDDINPGAGDSTPSGLTAIGDTLFFSASEPSSGTELWIATNCGNDELDQGESCDDGNLLAGDGCDGHCATEQGWTCPTPGSPCSQALSNYLSYKTKASVKDATGERILDNVFPEGWVITVDDVDLDDADADDPENFEVLKALGLANPAVADGDGTLPASAAHYLRYQMKSGLETVGPANESGAYDRPPKHIPRLWQLTNRFGTVNVVSQRVTALLLPAASSLAAAPAAPADDTHFVCYKVKPTKDVTDQTPDAGKGAGKFPRGLQAFVEDELDDCALDAGGNASFEGTPVSGTCLFDIGKPSQLCNPMNKSAVEAPRETTATIEQSQAASAQSLLCYKAKLASAVTGENAVSLLSVAVGDKIDPVQSRHARRTAKGGNPVYTAPGNGFPSPVVLDTTRPDTVCVVTEVLGVAPAR